MDHQPDRESLLRNVKIFVWFRVLFNARFYYPIFAIFFTDLGLSVGQFLWLNAIWAITIVLFEVPSGVLADLVGRRKLVLFAAASMMIEMALLIVAPQNGGWVLFGVCALNRFLSGLAEAAASGADEALAYDSLSMAEETGEEVEEKWDRVLVSAMRWRSAGMLVAMPVGALVFDHAMMTKVFGDYPAVISLKMPVILCFVTACICFVLACRLVDLGIRKRPPGARARVGDISEGILDAGKWVLRARWIAGLIAAALMIDAVSRTFVTLLSEYYRSISLPEYSYGFIGALMSVGGWVVPMYVRPLVKLYSPRTNMLMAGAIAVLGLLGASVAHSWWGVLPCFVVMISLVHVGFLMSRYINKEAPSEMRASILSVNNLTLNLGYGVFSALFAVRMKQTAGDLGDMGAFDEALSLTPWVLLVYLVLWFMTSASWSRNSLK
ncbi:hypothetical protein Rhal01_00916 [Rubritalea halochordaticola]|uniref:MFS transporter n=1 Tax=Rubritalea halochordaticola TaxID=714537 RepID=A0ABP9V2A3_9BACT